MRLCLSIVLLALISSLPLRADLVLVPEITDPPAAQPAEVTLPIVTRAFASDRAIAGPLNACIDDLRSFDFQKREAASNVLLHLPPNRLSELSEALTRETDPEAFVRLVAIVSHQFLKARTPVTGTTSILGIKFFPEVIRPNPDDRDELQLCIHINAVQPGYPAAQELRPDDRIIAIDGTKFSITTQDTDFIKLVRSHKPGDLVQCTVLRQNELLDIPVQLAAIPPANADNIDNAIQRRDDALTTYLRSLTTTNNQPLVFNDLRAAPNPGTVDIRYMPDGSIVITPRK